MACQVNFMKIDGSGQRKTQRGVCSRAHGKRAVPIGYKLSRGEGVFWTVFGTGTMPTSTPVASSRGEGGLLTGLRHSDPAHRYLSGIPAWRRGTSGRSSARPSVSIFGERGDTLRPARTSAYSAPWISRARRHRGMSPRHIQRTPGISRGRRRRGMNGQHIQ